MPDVNNDFKNVFDDPAMMNFYLGTVMKKRKNKVTLASYEGTVEAIIFLVVFFGLLYFLVF